MAIITELTAREILDSRGYPTVLATCILDDGSTASASVPSGRSTGAAEALELRDGDPKRYSGQGCQKAAANVSGVIADHVCRKPFDTQAAFDQAMIELDGTHNKSNLGGNAILAASVAFARACATQRQVPLYQHFSDMLGKPLQTMPRLTINLFSGGKHAGKQVAIQDVLLVPASATSIDESLVMTHDVYHAAADLMYKRYGMRLLTADEGGLAPPFESIDAMIDTAVEAIKNAGQTPGHDMALALDVASSHFYENNHYQLDGKAIDSHAMIDKLSQWAERWPIVSIEDGLYEDDWDHWPHLCERLQSKLLVLGDDLLCTNPQRIQRAITETSCSALLLKVNQIGTLTEAAQAYRLAKDAGWQVTISVRSGETEDDWAADLAVGWAGDQFKNGSITQSERLAKYNRMLWIESQTNLPMVPWPLG